ncbi:MAG TPA: DUF2339 domain-containing protein [Candidatus Acidoferrum sp.]|nr:DUF2339 domain-containing protein [Candidatus Acidoferrum sp.]
MESGLALLALLVVALVVVGPILAIAALVQVSSLKKLVDQIPRLTSRIYDLERKFGALDTLLKEQGSSASVKPVPAPATHLPEAATPERARPPLTQQPQTPAPPRAVSEPPTPPATPSHITAPLSSHREPAGQPDTDVETMIAGHWFYYVGILALALAATFFLKYAFDNNWIGPTGRVAIGLLVGSAMFPLSHWLLGRGYRYFSEGIAGLGTTILYLSIWAGWHYYALFEQSTAFVLMIVVTAVTTIVAIGRKSERIAVLALIGGVLTPAIVSTGRNEEVVLFTYLAILGAAMLVIAWKRDWKTVPPVLFASTVFYFWGWYAEFYRLDELTRTLAFATIFFALFGALPAIRSIRDGELPGLEIGLVIANAMEFLIALRVMLWPEYRWGLTLAVLALAAAHLLAERALPQKPGRTTQITRMLYAGLALTFATLAIPIRLEAHWITLAWATEGLVLVWCGLRVFSRALRAAGLLMFAIVAVRVVVLPIEVGFAPSFLLNARFLTMTYCAVAAIAAFALARRSEAEIEGIEARIFFALAIAGNFCFLVAISRETWDLLGRTPSLGIDRGLAQQLGLSMLWVVYALAQIIPGVRWKSVALRWQGLALLGVTIIKVFFFDLSFLARFYRIISFFALGLVLLGVSFFYQKMSAKTAKT